MLAAVASIWATVTTPVPPMPVIRTENRSRSTVGTGSDSDVASSAGGVLLMPAEPPGTTVRNDGQSPSRQEKSLLQDGWWIRVLRPYSVATGCTDTQLDFSPQSPQ